MNPLARRGFLRRRGAGKVPAVEIDGNFVTDSMDIAYAPDKSMKAWGQRRMKDMAHKPKG